MNSLNLLIYVTGLFIIIQLFYLFFRIYIIIN